MALHQVSSLVLRGRFLVVLLVAVGGLITLSGSERVWSLGHRHHSLGSVIGKDTPQAIPDDVAYRQILNTIAGMAATPKRQKALDAYFHHIEVTAAAGLGLASDSLTLLKEDQDTLKEVSLQLHSRTQVAIQGNTGEARQTLVNAAIAKLDTNLSPNSSHILRAFVTYGVKPRMKIVR
jgi:hypothetical protein